MKKVLIIIRLEIQSVLRLYIFYLETRKLKFVRKYVRFFCLLVFILFSNCLIAIVL